MFRTTGVTGCQEFVESFVGPVSLWRYHGYIIFEILDDGLMAEFSMVSIQTWQNAPPKSIDSGWCFMWNPPEMEVEFSTNSGLRSCIRWSPKNNEQRDRQRCILNLGKKNWQCRCLYIYAYEWLILFRVVLHKDCRFDNFKMQKTSILPGRQMFGRLLLDEWVWIGPESLYGDLRKCRGRGGGTKTNSCQG